MNLFHTYLAFCFSVEARTNAVTVSASARHGIRHLPYVQNANATPPESGLVTRGYQVL